VTTRAKFDRLLLVSGLLLAISNCAHAYIDPGSASVIYTVGLAPILAFLGWMGRRVVRMLRRSDGEELIEDHVMSDGSESSDD